MIDREFAKSQIASLGCLPFPPTTDEGMGELINTLAHKARSKQHAKRVIDAIIEAPGEDRNGQRRWPDPERIRALAWSMLEDREKQRACEHCGGGGWISVTIGQYDCAKRCICNPEGQQEEEEPVKKQKPALAGGRRGVPYRDLED